MRYLNVIILVGFISCSSSSFYTDINQVKTIADFENSVDKLIEKTKIPGLSVAVIKNDSLAYQNSFGYADEKQNRLMTGSSVFQLWSVTKIFTAIAVLQLDEKGHLDLDKYVSDYLPFFKTNTDQKITVRSLLSHSSGIDDIGMKIIGWIHYSEKDQ